MVNLLRIKWSKVCQWRMCPLVKYESEIVSMRVNVSCFIWFGMIYEHGPFIRKRTMNW